MYFLLILRKKKHAENVSYFVNSGDISFEKIQLATEEQSRI